MIPVLKFLNNNHNNFKVNPQLPTTILLIAKTPGKFFQLIILKTIKFLITLNMKKKI